MVSKNVVIIVDDGVVIVSAFVVAGKDVVVDGGGVAMDAAAVVDGEVVIVAAVVGLDNASVVGSAVDDVVEGAISMTNFPV